MALKSFMFIMKIDVFITFSKDIWDLAFILADENQTCISRINNLLLFDNRFEKIEVDFDEFK